MIRLADAKPVQLGHTVKANARWRLYAFAGTGNPVSKQLDIWKLCNLLDTSPDSSWQKITPKGLDSNAVFDVMAIFQQYHRDMDIGAMPDFLLSKIGILRLTDYKKMFCADHTAGDIYALCGVHRERGCILIVRPNQQVADVLPIDGFTELSAFFG